MINLIVGARQGQANKTFEESYERHFDTVYKLCFSYMKNAADTEDMVADVFEKLLKSGTVFNDVEHEKAWLLRTAINRCKDYFKHWWRSRANIDDYADLEIKNPFRENEE